MGFQRHCARGRTSHMIIPGNKHFLDKGTGETDNKYVQLLVLQHCCKTGSKEMLRVLPPTNQTCLATNQVVAGCEKLLQKVESRILPAQGKFALRQVT